MNRADEDEYREFVHARLDRLRRTAYLLCRDWHTADDLVSITLARLFRTWRRARQAGNLDAYVRAMLTNAFLDERRRPWRREDSTAHPPDTAANATPDAEVGDRAALGSLLATLPRRQRAVIVLRFYCDMSVTEVAQLLGVSEGTVKSQSARGLQILRAAAPDHVGELS
jgi:RNA polymerase sigma-70 factor (sigma-E family)